MDRIRIDEILPANALESEVVLHVRRHLRSAIRRRATTAPSDLAHLLGFVRGEGKHGDWIAAATSDDPLHAGAAVAASRRGAGTLVVALGHDAAHIVECKHWLAARKAQDAAFDAIKASDLATLLELSKARDIACARGLDGRGRERFLPVLIQGATGTGKELLAESIHKVWTAELSRGTAPWEVVQVAGMMPDMVNDELFGHVRGAFTSANAEREGRLEAASGGTLLIDEVGDLSKEAQLRLLRFLQTQAISRVGENRERQLDVRVIAATLRDLDALVAKGDFREDLLHRLRIGSGLRLQPLVSREGFFDHVLPDLLVERRHLARPPITRSARDALAHHTWPGNLRELVGVLDEVVALAADETIRLEHLPAHLQQNYVELPLAARAPGFLLDEVDGQGLVEEHIRWRIGQVNESLAVTVAPPPDQKLATLGQFLSLLDDASEEHRRTVGEIGRLLDLDQQRRRMALTVSFWQGMLGVVPPTVAALVQEAVDDAAARQVTSEEAIRSAQQAASIDSNPWVRLMREIHELPLLREVNPGQLATAFLAVFNILKLFAPSWIDQIRTDSNGGGFAKIRERVVAALRDSKATDEKNVVEVPIERTPAARRTRSEWRTIAEYPTQRAAVMATGYDPATMAKYFQAHGIPHPWRSRATRANAPTKSRHPQLGDGESPRRYAAATTSKAAARKRRPGRTG